MKDIFRYQFRHLLLLVLLMAAAVFAFLADPAAARGEFLGAPGGLWYLIALAIPVIHQVYVLLVWRIELYRKFFSRHFGLERSFRIYAVGFMILFLGRLVSLFFLAAANRDSLGIPRGWTLAAAVLVMAISAYVLYSVLRFFSIRRALGIDHFIEGFNEPFVRGGIYRFSSNGMYIYGLMALYLPGLLLNSRAALYGAIFNHLYIWAHYFFTEKPDMEVIYGGRK